MSADPNFRNLDSLSAVPVSYNGALNTMYRTVFKRVFDVFLVIVSLPPVLLVIAILAGLVALGGGKPFYSHLRVGQKGRLYRMWKLRTMNRNADVVLSEYLECNPEARAEWDSSQKLRKDPRITPLGRLLRKSSLDELPQLWNVFVGDMSLVGPRPMMPDQRDIYPGAAYYQLRPGITGPWQVSERNDTSFAERARFDTEYERYVSLWTDLKLLAATVRAVLRGTGC